MSATISIFWHIVRVHLGRWRHLRRGTHVDLESPGLFATYIWLTLPLSTFSSYISTISPDLTTMRSSMPFKLVINRWFRVFYCSNLLNITLVDMELWCFIKLSLSYNHEDISISQMSLNWIYLSVFLLPKFGDNSSCWYGLISFQSHVFFRK